MLLNNLATKKNLLKALNAVIKVVERKPLYPILSHVLIESRNGRLSFLASSGETQIRSFVEDASCSRQDAAMAISAKDLQDVLKSLPKHAEIHLEIENHVEIRFGVSSFRLPALPAADFPRLASIEPALARFSIAQKELKRLIELTQFAMAKGDIRQYLNGLFLTSGGDRLEAVATDGHRLSHAAAALAEAAPKFEVILPRRTVIEIHRLLADAGNDDLANVTVCRDLVSLTFGNVEIASMPIAGTFPRYSQVMPTAESHKSVIEARLGPLHEALQRIAIVFEKDDLHGVKFSVEDWLVLTGSGKSGRSATEKPLVTYQGKPLTTSFDVRYLLDVLRVLKSRGGDQVSIALDDPTSVALITSSEVPEFKHIILPMRI